MLRDADIAKLTLLELQKDMEHLKNNLKIFGNYKSHPCVYRIRKISLGICNRKFNNSEFGVTDEIAENLRKYWNEGEIVEMMGVVALFGFLNRWNDSMGTEMEDGAVESGEKFLRQKGWTVGKHRY